MNKAKVIAWQPLPEPYKESDLYIEARLQAIKDIASASCSDIKDADNIVGFCDEIYSAIPKLDKIIEELELHSFECGEHCIPYDLIKEFKIIR